MIPTDAKDRSLLECDLCLQTFGGEPVVRRLHSARRVEKKDDAAWSTSAVMLHFVDFREHEVIIGPSCRRAAWRFYLLPFVPSLVSLVLWILWIGSFGAVTPHLSPNWVLVAGLVPVIAFIAASSHIRRRYGTGDRQFGETPMRFLSLDSYAIMVLTRRYPHRVFWTPKWFRYYQERFR